ncbi:hypothetical protein NL676_036484 [Syzygium grande]|nr:hypothetical protein NL676_036484 [Syzygium grande]
MKPTPQLQAPTCINTSNENQCRRHLLLLSTCTTEKLLLRDSLSLHCNDTTVPTDVLAATKRPPHYARCSYF